MPWITETEWNGLKTSTLHDDQRYIVADKREGGKIYTIVIDSEHGTEQNTVKEIARFYDEKSHDIAIQHVIFNLPNNEA